MESVVSRYRKWDGKPIRAGVANRAGSDPDQFDFAFLDVSGLGQGGRGFEPLDEGAEL